MAESKINIVQVNPNTFELQTYSSTDETLISNQIVEGKFGLPGDYVEYFVYSFDKLLLYPVDTPAISSTDYTVTNDPYLQNQGFYSTININPLVDASELGFDVGQFYTIYNFLKTKLSSSVDNQFYITEISSDRTEVRLDTNNIPDVSWVPLAREFQAQISASFPYYTDFYLNFGYNNLIIANNILVDTSIASNPTILVKLYEPLPQQYTLKSECWIVEQAAESVAYQIEISQLFDVEDDTIQISGPNFNLSEKDLINNSTTYQDFASLTATTVSGSFNQLDSLLEEKGIEINVDYSLYNNFIFLSSAYQRLYNFRYKLELLEELSATSSLLSSITGSALTSSGVSSSLAINNYQINDIIRNFDGYEYYLYYESSSTTWPKQNALPPYTLYSTTSPEGITWFTSQSIVANDYDQNNSNNLYWSIPEYIREDTQNEPYVLFSNMVGQSFDNSWLYTKDLSNRYNTDNRINFGISKDLVADAIRSFGVKLYQNNFSSNDLYIAYLGYNPETGGYLPPTGSELITNYVTSSADPVPLDDVNKRIYKRIYHNLPYLLKKKGTVDGLKALITIYGIPDTILRISEFGGKDKINSNDWDFWQQKFNYKYDLVQDSDTISTPLFLNSAWGSEDNRPQTIAFRFKTPGVKSALTFPSQSLFVTDSTPNNVVLGLQYNLSNYSSGSYSGSILNPEYEYANLVLYPDITDLTTSASIYLPFFDGGWWNVAFTRDTDNWNLYAANNIYNGDDGSQLGFIASASLNTSSGPYAASVSASFGSDFGNSISIFEKFSGSLQEIRYYTQPIAVSSFEDFTMNPDSIETTLWDGAPLQLTFRGNLGGELYTESISTHPKVAGSWITTSSFDGDHSNFIIGSNNFTPNTETVYFEQPIAGIKNAVSNKIKPISSSLPSGDTLSRYITIEQNTEAENNYTNNVNYAEIAFSPQNEINEDIMDQLGFFNMGEFIGDPRQRFSEATSYPDLDLLRNSFFEKYTGNYDLTDYIRLIKYFDNSLFKMIKDFTPARTSLASGVVVKQTLLERSKYPMPEVTQTQSYYEGTLDIVEVSGSTGGTFNQYNGLTNNWEVTQSWTETIVTPYGLTTQIHSNQDEFYNGELSGSTILVENGELNEFNPFKQVDTTPTIYNILLYGGDGAGGTPTSSAQFLSSVFPVPGTASFWSQDPSQPTVPGQSPFFIPYAKIHSLDLEGINNGLTLASVESIVWGGFTFYPITISPRDGGDYYFFEFAPGNPAQYLLGGDPQLFTNQLLVFSPKVTDATGPFQNNEYNPIINNSEFNRSNTSVRQVDYTTNQLVPINFSAIISGTAEPASIPNSNYTSYNYITPRYVGSKNTTDDFNSDSLTTTNLIKIQQNVNLGDNPVGLPSVDLNQTYFAYFNWAGGTSPEWGDFKSDRTTYNIRFFVNEQGNIIKPINDSNGVNLGIMRQNFTEGGLATSALTNTNLFGTQLSILNGSYPIFKSGKTIQPIIYNQYSVFDGNGNTVDYNFTSSISFNLQPGTTPTTDWLFQANRITTEDSFTRTIFDVTPEVIDWNNVSFDSGSYFDLSGDYYEFPTNTDTQVRFIAGIASRIEFAWTQLGQQATITYAIQKAASPYSNWTNLSQGNLTFSKFTNGFQDVIIETQPLNFLAGDRVRVVVTSLSINPFSSNAATIKIGAGSFFYNTQLKSPGTIPSASSPYFTSNTVNLNVLTASAEFSSFYGFTATGIPNSGFNAISYPFIPQVNDEIRFEGVESEAYTITNVTYTNRLYFTLNHDISTGININQFLIRRYVDDPAFIILDVDKPAGDSGGGILKPEYLLGRIENRVDSILQNLEEKGLIES
jgi:hypothetical protein